MSRNQAAEIDSEADRVEANRAKAPTTVALANLLFDLRDAHPKHSTALEDLAIMVDGTAQSGIELSPRFVAACATEANRILGLPTTCQQWIALAALCSLTTVPGLDRCAQHAREGA